MKIAAQTTGIRGIVVDAATFENLQEVEVALEGSTFNVKTAADGEFIISSGNLPDGNQVLVISRLGYTSLRFPVILERERVKDLGLVPLQRDMFREQILMGTISLSDNELDEESGADNVSGLLLASRDVFLNAAAFDFSQAFFRPRGLGSESGKVYINGLEMNKMFNGRPQWSNWGGLNDVQRNQVFFPGSTPADVGFGGLGGSTNIIMRASAFSRGGRVSYAGANRSYTGRVMATYNSGELAGGWAISVSASRRFAEEGYIDGTLYDSNSLFLSAEKKFGAKHSLNFTGFYTPVIRGRSSANTQEVTSLKGSRYNSFWGYQEGVIRNSRLREIAEPVIILNHFWKLSERIQINTNIGYQFGKTANTRIDFGGTRLVFGPEGRESFLGGGSNPDPSYYQKMPSYFLRNISNPNYEAAYLAQENFINDGKLDWNSLYTANRTSTETGGNAIYVLSEDRTDDRQLMLNSILEYVLNESVRITGKVGYSRLLSENYANIRDLLGGNAFLDVDIFAEAYNEDFVGDRAQSDLQNRNRLIGEGQPYKYNYELKAEVTEAFANLYIKRKKADLYFSGLASHTTYQRKGLFQNGSHPQNSLGESETLRFTAGGLKAGGNLRLTGRHVLDLNAAYFSQPPYLRNVFSNARLNNTTVAGLKTEKIISADAGYIYRSPFLKARLTGYFLEFRDGTEVSFYYADGLSGLGRTSTTAFVQEVLTGIEKQHLGVEMGADLQATSTIRLKFAAALGQFIYSGNPELYLTSDRFRETANYGKAYLKNYRLPGGPQRAAQLGFEYRDPDFWWFGTTVNFFSHAFVDISPLSRTTNFLTDADGLPLLDYDERRARELLRQEQLEDYVLVNAIGGKSWRIRDRYIGFFISLNNIFGAFYRTGGFEQARNANYRTLNEDQKREKPLFDSKYWYGTGATFFANAYLRF